MTHAPIGHIITASMVCLKLNSKNRIFWSGSVSHVTDIGFGLLKKSNVNFENGSSNKWEIHFEMHNGFKSWITSWIIDFNRACSRIGTSIFKTRWIQSETKWDENCFTSVFS